MTTDPRTGAAGLTPRQQFLSDLWDEHRRRLPGVREVGLLDRDRCPVVGAEAARKVLDPSLPSNELIAQAGT